MESSYLKTKHILKKVLKFSLQLTLVGFVLLVVTFLTGAQLIDGLFGVYKNSQLQNAALFIGLLLVACGIISSILSALTLLLGKFSFLIEKAANSPSNKKK